MTLKKGDKIKITGNSVFSVMGYKEVTGTVFMIYPDGHGFAFKCNQTGCMETCDFNDGNIKIE